MIQAAANGAINATFINPPFLRRFSRESRSPSVTKSNTLYYPHFLCYAAAAASTVEGVTIDVIDGSPGALTFEEVVGRTRKNDARLVVLDTSTPSIYSDLKLASEIKAAQPEAVVCVAGPHVTATIDDTFAYSRENGLQLDAVLDGEYDHTVQEMSRRIMAGEDWRDVKGLAYARNGEVVSTGKSEPIHDFDAIPFVTKIYDQFLNIPDYFMAHTKTPMVTVITGRGCPYRCSFCQLPQVMYGHKYRTRSPENVVDEFEYIETHLPYVKGVMIEDDTFTADQARVREICRLMVERGVTNLEYTCNARADVKLETLEAMKQANFKMFCVGFESGDQEILNKMRKGTKMVRIRDFVANAADVGIHLHGCFMYGNKFETRDTMERTLEFALSLDIDSAQFYPIMVSPGTYDYDFYKAEGLLRTEDFSEWNDGEGQHRSTVERPGLSNKEIEDFCDLSRRRFYLRPRYVFNKLRESLTDVQHFQKNLRGFSVLAKHLVKRKGA